MYHEKPAPSHTFWLLAGFFILLTLPNVWMPELSPDEAIIALMTRDLAHGGSLILPTLMGQQTIHPPLASWLLGFIGFFLGVNSVTVRLVGILSLGGLAAIAAYMIYPLGGRQAAGVAAASIVSCLLSLRMGISGDSKMLFALLINAAWFVFYHLSREHKQWLYAWFFSHLLLCLAMLAGGPKALFFFYLPLFFMRRPIHVLRRMRKADHLISLAFLLTVLAIWLLMVPHVSHNVVLFFREFEPERATAGYLARLVTFPVSALIAFAPWIFFAWPAFCLAFRPLEKDSTLAQYCRTIVGSFFFCFWLLPEGKVVDLMPLLGPLGILTGMHYAILARRHGRTLLWVTKALSVAALIGAAVAAIYGLVTIGELELQELGLLLYLSVAGMLVAVGLGIYLLRNPRHGPIWLVTLMALVSVRLVWVNSMHVHRWLYAGEQRRVGGQLTAVVPEQMTLYLYNAGARRSVVALFYYADRHTIRVEQLQSLPTDREVVYLVTNDIRPISPNWEWSPVGDPQSLNDIPYRVWRGTRRRN